MRKRRSSTCRTPHPAHQGAAAGTTGSTAAVAAVLSSPLVRAEAESAASRIAAVARSSATSRPDASSCTRWSVGPAVWRCSRRASSTRRAAASNGASSASCRCSAPRSECSSTVRRPGGGPPRSRRAGSAVRPGGWSWRPTASTHAPPRGRSRSWARIRWPSTAARPSRSAPAAAPMDGSVPAGRGGATWPGRSSLPGTRRWPGRRSRRGTGRCARTRCGRGSPARSRPPGSRRGRAPGRARRRGRGAGRGR